MLGRLRPNPRFLLVCLFALAAQMLLPAIHWMDMAKRGATGRGLFCNVPTALQRQLLAALPPELAADLSREHQRADARNCDLPSIHQVTPALHSRPASPDLRAFRHVFVPALHAVALPAAPAPQWRARGPPPSSRTKISLA